MKMIFFSKICPGAVQKSADCGEVFSAAWRPELAHLVYKYKEFSLQRLPRKTCSATKRAQTRALGLNLWGSGARCPAVIFRPLPASPGPKLSFKGSAASVKPLNPPASLVGASGCGNRFRPRSLVSGLWSPVFGLWSFVFGLWFLCFFMFVSCL